MIKFNKEKCTFYSSSCGEYLDNDPAYIQLKIEGGEILKLPVCNKCEKLLERVENRVSAANGNTEI